MESTVKDLRTLLVYRVVYRKDFRYKPKDVPSIEFEKQNPRVMFNNSRFVFLHFTNLRVCHDSLLM